MTGLRGAIVVKTSAGRAPLYSALEEGFVDKLLAMSTGSCQVFPFEDIVGFHAVMTRLIDTSEPAVYGVRGAGIGEGSIKDE
jgi:hypothetical protein